MKTVSLQTAKALVEAGVVIECEKCWSKVAEDDWRLMVPLIKEHLNYHDRWLAAPDATELLEWLPTIITLETYSPLDNFLLTLSAGEEYTASYGMAYTAKNVNPAEALAQLAIHLRKEGLV